jgi:hypothetical protein|tara:strand:- start:287 stop:1342 length:1056 start_codon:yes stop_codon:yes gene_type:complete
MLKKHMCAAFAAALLSGCGGSSDGGGSAQDFGKDQTGRFSHDIEGLRYTSVSEDGLLYEGRTGRRGQYLYAEGDTLTFYAGDYQIGAISARPYVSPAHFDIAVEVLDYSLPEELGLDDVECPSDEDDETAGGGEEGVEEPAPEPTPPEPIPIQCEEWFPDEGIEESTMQLLAFLSEANVDTLSTQDQRIIIGLRDENAIAEDFLSANAELPGNLDVLRFLSELSLAPLAGDYPVKADITSGSDLCPLTGELVIQLGYAPGGDERSGTIYLDGARAWREDLGTTVDMVAREQQPSRNLYPSYTVDLSTTHYRGVLSLDVTMTPESGFEGTFEWSDGGDRQCAGSIEPAPEES